MELELNNPTACISAKKRRRSSFINRSHCIYDESETSKIDSEDKEKNSSFDKNWKTLYVDKLKEEYADWKHVFLDSKYKYKETQKRVRSRFLDKSLSLQEVQDNPTFRQLTDLFNKLIEANEINKKLKVMLHQRRSKVLNCKERQLNAFKWDKYNSEIENDLFEINLDDYTVDSDMAQSVLLDIDSFPDIMKMFNNSI